MIELENQKKYYIDLLEKVNLLTKKLDNIINNLNTLDDEIINYYTLNDTLADNGIIKNNKQDIINLNNTLKNNVRLEIVETINQIDQQLNV